MLIHKVAEVQFYSQLSRSYSPSSPNSTKQ